LGGVERAALNPGVGHIVLCRRQIYLIERAIDHTATLALCDNCKGQARPARRVARRNKMGDLLQPTHLLVIAVVLLVLFGAKRLPELGKGLGEGLKGFKEGIKGVSDPAPTTTQQSTQTAPPPPPASPEPPRQA